MHVTACLAGQDDVDVEVEESCRTLQALKEAIVVALPQLCVEGFDVSVGGRGLDDDEGVVSLVGGVRLDVSADTRCLSALALREAGREVNEAGLLAAVKTGDVSLVTLYLDAGVPLDCTDEDGFTPLHVSCSNGCLSVATLLLDRGSAAIDAKTRDEKTPHVPCRYRLPGIARPFLFTPLHLSCYYGHLEIARLLLDRGSAAIEMKNCDGWSPLHCSCWHEHLEVARLLLDQYSAIDEKDRSGRTPLHLSCKRGHLETARLLLNRGSAAIDEKCSHDYTPLHVACCNGHVETVKLLLDRGSAAIDENEGQGGRRCTPLHLSCYYGRLETARLLLDRGCAIDEKDGSGWTPLHFSCGEDHLEISTLLLDRGSNAIDVVEGCGWTPLHFACLDGLLNIATLLLDRGCSVNCTAARSSRYPPDILQLLWERGHDVLPDVPPPCAKRSRGSK